MNYKQIVDFFSYKFHYRKKPIVLQMPITSRCNSRCKTCNIWKYKDKTDIDPLALKEVFKDSFFSEVRTVGLNGGEFTLIPNFIEILKSVLTLPKLSGVALISNGLLPDRLFEILKIAKEECSKNRVKINICISFDGVGEIHENVRGIHNCFKRTTRIIEELYSNKDVYCDSFSLGCTLSKYNIAFIREIESFLSNYKDINIEYHLAVPNKRIKTFDDYKDYYVLNDEKSRLLAAEFFYEKFLKSSNSRFKRQQFVNFYFLKEKGKGRLCTCDYLNRDVTIDENLNMSLCATASDAIGCLRDESASILIKKKRLKEIENEIVHLCNECVHYSYHSLTIKGRVKYINELIRNRFIFEYYRIECVEKCFSRQKQRLLFLKNISYEYLKMFYFYVWKLQ